MKSPSRLFALCLATACLGAGLVASTAQAASPAWEPIAASGPTNLPPVQSEIQRLRVDAEAGTFALTAHKLAATGTGNLGAPNSPTILGYSNTSGSAAVGQTVIGPFIQPGTTITGVFPLSGKLALVLSKPATNPSAVNDVALQTTSASATTPDLPFDAAASKVEEELNALATVGGEGGSVAVSGGPGGKGGNTPYFISYGGSFANTNLPGIGLPLLTADGSGLSGGVNTGASLSTALDGGPGTSQIGIYPQNVGGAPSSGTTTLKFILPEKVVTSAAPNSQAAAWSCPGGAGATEMTCTSTRIAGPGVALPPLLIPVTAQPGATSGIVEIEVWGGGTASTEAMPTSYSMPLVVSAIPAPPGLQAWTAGAYKDNGEIDTRAGAHPYSASTGILVNTVRAPSGLIWPAGDLRDIVVDIPPGFLGNPMATEQCPEAIEHIDCSYESIMAFAEIPLGGANTPFTIGYPSVVNNIEAPRGFPAKFRFLSGNNQVLVNVVASLRSDEDHGISAGSYNSPQIKPVMGAFFTIWGNPADATHDSQRCKQWFDNGNPFLPTCRTREEIDAKDTAFLTNPVDCAEQAARTPKAVMNVNTWQNPTLLFAGEVALQPVKDCEELEFKVNKFAFDPGTGAADSPASFTTEFELPSAGLLGLDEEGNFDPEARMNPSIRETVVDLPEGVVLNASAADGLGACSFAQIGYKGNNFGRPNQIRFNKAPNSCPDASKIGSGALKSALLAETLSVDLFLAEQGNANPFGSLFAIYLVVESEERGLNIKLPGEVQVNGQTGKQRVVFRDNPPLPFDSLKLTLKGGPRSPLATPTTCGNYSTTATNTPWSAPESGPPLSSPSAFQINSGPGGSACANTPAERPFDIGLAAGSTNPIAGAHSPFQIQLTRADGNQELDRLDIAMPPGFVASLRGVPYCSDAQIAAATHGQGRAEQANPSCPAASRVGSTNSAAGSGPSPFYAPGALYLSGPYKGAPLSVTAITPAVAGPFDLGNVVVRSALYIDPVTARITARTDPLPRILEGVPLRIRDVRVNLDRPNWAQNPTSCEEMAVNVTAHGSNGAVSQPANRFQVGNCAALGFKPRTNIQLFGGTKRGKYQGVRAVVRPRPGDANISRTAVRFPTSAFVAQENIRTVCTRVQWAADNCPKGSIYGRAVAFSPLLDQPLRGNVYLRSSNNQLPDAVADLRGPAHQPIKIEVAIKNDSVKGALRNTVQSAPDAPVSFFRLQMFGGKKGLIVNSRNICQGKNQARVAMGAHNGRRSVENVHVFNKRCKQQRRAERRAKRKAAAKNRGGAKRSNLSQLQTAQSNPAPNKR